MSTGGRALGESRLSRAGPRNLGRRPVKRDQFALRIIHHCGSPDAGAVRRKVRAAAWPALGQPLPARARVPAGPWEGDLPPPRRGRRRDDARGFTSCNVMSGQHAQAGARAKHLTPCAQGARQARARWAPPPSAAVQAGLRRRRYAVQSRRSGRRPQAAGAYAAGVHVRGSRGARRPRGRARAQPIQALRAGLATVNLWPPPAGGGAVQDGSPGGGAPTCGIAGWRAPRRVGGRGRSQFKPRREDCGERGVAPMVTGRLTSVRLHLA